MRKSIVKAELKTGMAVELANGETYIVFHNLDYDNGKCLVSHSLNNSINLNTMTEDLEYKGNRSKDIVKVFGMAVSWKEVGISYGDCIWERPTNVELTIADIEKKLGIKNLKIIK